MNKTPFFSRRGVHRMLEGTPQRTTRRIVPLAIAALIVANVVAVMIESLPTQEAHSRAYSAFELFSVIVFSAEYAARIWVCVEDPRYAGRWGRLRFALTPMALVDLAAVAPFWLSWLVVVDMRMLRALRLLRIFKLTRHSTSMDLLITVIRGEAGSILSAMFIMLVVITLAASGMYVIEREHNPAFESIPAAMWWAAVTLTTVGYGDVVPVTVPGKVFGLLITVAGVGMVALPAGILASGFSLELQRRREQFRARVKLALLDGEVSSQDRVRLEAERGELGVSEEDARSVLLAEEGDIAAESEGSRTTAKRACPACGHRF